jgi:hypothetical protein
LQFIVDAVVGLHRWPRNVGSLAKLSFTLKKNIEAILIY